MFSASNRFLALVAVGAAVLGGIFLIAQPDRQTGVVETPAIKNDNVQAQRWQYEILRDPFDGSVTRYARMMALDPIRVGGAEHGVELAVLSSDDSAVQLSTPVLASCGMRGTFVRLRFDDEPVEWARCQQIRSVGRHGTVWLIPISLNGARADPYPPRIQQAQKLTIEVPTYDGAAAATFAVSGLTR